PRPVLARGLGRRPGVRSRPDPRRSGRDRGAADRAPGGRAMIRVLIAAVLCGLTGCGGCSPWDLDLERMIEQPKLTPYKRCEICPGGTAMMTPPAGTMPRGVAVAPVPLVRGRQTGRYLDRIPIEVTRDVLERGRNRFDIFCAACHGRLGNGVSKVAENMTLRR